jgi:uncharacterized protein DUF3597
MRLRMIASRVSWDAPGWRVLSYQEDSMSIFGNIISAIFGSKPAGTAAAAPGGAPASASAAVAEKPISRAEVEAMIANIAAQQGEKYNWKQSIVDLMKLLKLDSSLAARKQLAQELGYTGALDGSAEMNIWLHKQVMTKLAESGGKVPDSLKK